MLKIKPATNYHIDSKSDFLYNITKQFIFKINQEVGIHKGRTLFGQYILEADNPIKGNYVITRKPNEDLVTLDLNKRPNIIEVCSNIIGNTNKDYIEYCREALKTKHTEAIYYYMSVINSVAYKDNKLDETKAKYIVNEYEYKGVHTIKEKYEACIKLVLDPEPDKIYGVYRLFNEVSGGIKEFYNVISNLVYVEGIPSFIMDKHGEVINSQSFANSLLNITTSIITSNSYEEFALKLLSNRGKIK